MKLGFVSAILDSWTYEEMMDFASEQGFACVEVACWPEEKAERSAIALRSDGAAARCERTVRLFGKTDAESDAEPL